MGVRSRCKALTTLAILAGLLCAQSADIAHAQPPSHSHHQHEHPPADDVAADEPLQAEMGTRPLLLIAGYCALIVLASLGGGWLPFVVHLTHTRMQFIMSFVAGLMLGIGLFHMLPHAYAENGSLDRSMWWMVVGLLTMFFLIRTFHFHQHGTVELLDDAQPAATHDQPATTHTHHHAASAAHHHDHDCPHHPPRTPHRLSWVGVALGLALHTLIDGVALGASVAADVGHETLWSLFGAGTFLAILLHKPLDAVSITSLMAASGWSQGWRHAVNAGFALMCPLGAGLFLLGLGSAQGDQRVVIGCALAFAAGVFLCISLGDLLPEVEFHTHDRIKLSLALLLGVALAYGIGYLEPAHVHAEHNHTNNG